MGIAWWRTISNKGFSWAEEWSIGLTFLTHVLDTTFNKVQQQQTIMFAKTPFKFQEYVDNNIRLGIFGRV
jgi:hypothetical protein